MEQKQFKLETILECLNNPLILNEETTALIYFILNLTPNQSITNGNWIADVTEHLLFLYPELIEYASIPHSDSKLDDHYEELANTLFEELPVSRLGEPLPTSIMARWAADSNHLKPLSEELNVVPFPEGWYDQPAHDKKEYCATTYIHRKIRREMRL